MEVFAQQWKSNPPMQHVVQMIAGALGIKFDKPAKPAGNNLHELADLVGVDGFSGSKPDWLIAAEQAEKDG